MGTCSIVPGITVSRPHHLLSELEATYFYLMERRGAVVDIREQWPILDIGRTLELCTAAGITHKYRGFFPEPFTIDFLITERLPGGLLYRAASVKSAADAENPQTRLRLAVEHAWCSERNIPWVLVDTSAFDKVLLSNLRFLRAWFRHRHEIDLHQAARFARCFHEKYAQNVLLAELVDAAARMLRMTEGAAQDLFRYCGWVDLIGISLTQHPLAFDQPLFLRAVHA